MGGGFNGIADHDLVLATVEDVDPARVLELAGRRLPDVAVTPVFNGHPVFWTRIESSSSIDVTELVARLSAGGIRVRYVTSTRLGSQHLPPPLDFSEARPRTGRDWPTRRATQEPEQDTPWRWFLRRSGANVDRDLCGTGAGTRLAVIDNDGLRLDQVPLDAEVPVGVAKIPRTQEHAALLVGWAVGARRDDGTSFRGVAPDAVPRVYCIPKPSDDVLSMPLALLRAVNDGADCVVCATYVEGLTSPLLDDALEFAVRVGRAGRGTIVVFPTGREMSSPEGATHSSLSLGLADPASDPRVFCVGPSARDGGWFLWRDSKGKFRPFANRGPAVRYLAPGDDLAYPFVANDRPTHAESSGASAIASGVILLALAQNPDLTRTELEELMKRTSVPLDPAAHSASTAVADARDLEPHGRDADGHNCKHGYGRLDARAACVAAADPVAQALVTMGELDAAEAYLLARRSDTKTLYSRALLRYAARVELVNASFAHAVKAVLRALRLGCGSWDCPAQPVGYLARQIGVALRLLVATDPPQSVAAELLGLDARLRSLEFDALRGFEQTLTASFRPFWVAESVLPSRVIDLHDPHGRASSPLGGRSRLTTPH